MNVTDTGPHKLVGPEGEPGAKPPMGVASGLRIGLRPIVWVLTLLALTATILYPTARIIYLSVTEAATGVLDLEVMREVLANPQTWTSTRNTVVLAFAATLIGLAVATPMAWSCARTDVPLSGLTRVLVLLTFMNPPILLGLAYVSLFGPGTGVLTDVAATLGLGDIYSWWGLLAVTVSCSYPIIFMLVSTALSSLDADLEHAAAAHGANGLTTTLRVTLPLVRPAIASGCLLSFVLALNAFGVQALIAIPANIPLLTTDIYANFSYPVQFTAAADLSVILMGISVLVSIAINLYVLRTTFPTIMGKGFRPGRVNLRPIVRYGALALNLAVLLVTLVGPMTVMVMTSFLPRSRELSLGSLSLDSYRALAELGSVGMALLNSLMLGAVSALGMVVIAVSLTYFHRQKTWFSRPAVLLAELPFVIPGIVLAVGMIAAYSRPPAELYGTYLILVLAYVAKFLPIALRFTQGAFGQVGLELEESAHAHGASHGQTLRWVLLPLVRRGVTTAAIISFIFAFNELSASILLISSGKEVSSTVLLTYAEEGLIQEMSAFAAILFAITAAAYAVISRLAGADFTGAPSKES